MRTTRRDVLTSALTAAGVALAPARADAAEHDHDHDHQHAHQTVPSDPALRVKALESLLVAKGAVDRAALDALIDTYEHQVGPRGTRLLARGDSARLDRELVRNRQLATGVRGYTFCFAPTASAAAWRCH